MSEEKKWHLELATYIRQGEPKQAEKSEAWRTAIGLQAVDGLETSEYLPELPNSLVKKLFSFRRRNGWPFIADYLKAYLSMPDKSDHTTLQKKNGC